MLVMRVTRRSQNVLVLIAIAVLTGGCVYRPLVSFDVFKRSPVASAELPESRPMLFMPTSRAARLPAPVLTETPEVTKELAMFRRGSFVPDSLGRVEKHLPAMKQIFADEGIPPELLNLALIESGYRTEAKSPVGAVGMWQLMKPTARVYGLKVNFFEDQRKDPILSTLAAARHLRDLYYNYNDWNLVLAAYNAGSGKVDRAIIRAGQADFWKLARAGHFRPETAQFVPRFIASCLAVKERNQMLAQSDLSTRVG